MTRAAAGSWRARSDGVAVVAGRAARGIDERAQAQAAFLTLYSVEHVHAQLVEDVRRVGAPRFDAHFPTIAGQVVAEGAGGVSEEVCQALSMSNSLSLFSASSPAVVPRSAISEARLEAVSAVITAGTTTARNNNAASTSTKVNPAGSGGAAVRRLHWGTS